ncbi:MAG: hypothetical protein AUH75_06090 [Gemmatimonadetes bacterium 13_1_40CM_4_65_7]|nr:MAG: hypothetical protein AUH75_06090 [Gemmatimonadetes bacterium 13_1_40CM_4_65_7]
MDMSLDQPTPIKRFWRTWRREIVRGSVLFGIVVGIGLFLRSVTRNIKDHLPTSLGALRAFGDMDWGDGEGGNLFGRGRNVGAEWHYHGKIKPTQRVWIRNTNGPIDVVGGKSDSLEVHVEKSWRNSDPGSVQIIPVPTQLGITICAVWEARETRCNEGGDYRMNGVRKNDVAVRFTVVLPKGVPIDASTVNGGLQIDQVSAPVDANTINGRIAVNTASGPVHATTVNGSIEANMQALSNGDVRLTTVNGSVMAGLPKRINAEIDAQTVNGRVDSDLPVKIIGKMSTRHLRGTIGTGGPTLKLVTVNGSITIHEAGPMPPPHPEPGPHPWVRVPRGRVSLPERP